jgi:hypothetical protein
MIKYHLRKIEPDGYGGNHTFNVTVTRALYKEYLRNNWFLVRKKYFIITSFLDWWKTISLANKIGFFAIVIPLFFGGLKWNIETYLNHEYHSLKNDYNSLNEKYYILQENYNDSITTLNERIETISQKLKTKKVSGKK